MSAVKVLAPAHPRAADANRPARGPLAVPAPNISRVEADYPPRTPETCFFRTLSDLAQRPRDVPEPRRHAREGAAAESRKAEADPPRARRRTERRPEPASAEVDPAGRAADEPAEPVRGDECACRPDEPADSAGDPEHAASEAVADADTDEASSTAEQPTADGPEQPSAPAADGSTAAAPATDESKPVETGSPEADVAARLMRQLVRQGQSTAEQMSRSAASSAEQSATAASAATGTDATRAAGTTGGPATPTPPSSPKAVAAGRQADAPPGPALEPGGEDPSRPAHRSDEPRSAGKASTPAQGRAVSFVREPSFELVRPAAAPTHPGLERLVAAAAGVSDTGGGDSAAQQGPNGSSSGDVASGRTDARPVASAASVSGAERAGVPEATASGGEVPFARVLGQHQPSADQAARNVDRIVEVIRSSIGTRDSSMTIRLEPPELGEIRLEARMHGDVLSIRIQAQTDAARELLVSRVDELREALDRHGIAIGRFDVDAKPAGPAPSSQGHQEQSDGPNPQMGDLLYGGSEQWQDRDSSSGDGDESSAPAEHPYAGELASDAGTPEGGLIRSMPTAESLVNLLA